MAYKVHPAWKPQANRIYRFRVNGVPHAYCADCLDVPYAESVSDDGIGVSAYGTCEACGFHLSSVGTAANA